VRVVTSFAAFFFHCPKVNWVLSRSQGVYQGLVFSLLSPVPVSSQNHPPKHPLPHRPPPNPKIPIPATPWRKADLLFDFRFFPFPPFFFAFSRPNALLRTWVFSGAYLSDFLVSKVVAAIHFFRFPLLRYSPKVFTAFPDTGSFS